MKWKKILVAVAACIGVTATSAFAAEMTASYDNGQVIVANDDIASDIKTVLILNTNDGAVITDKIEKTDIKYIDERDELTSFKVGTLQSGTYEVRAGGDGKLHTTTFDVPENVKIGDTGYASFSEALKKAGDKAEISLVESVSDDIEISAGKDITIDLGGKNFDGTITNNGNLTVKGTGNFNGTITGNGSITISGGTYMSVPFSEGANVTIDGGTFGKDAAIEKYLVSDCAIKTDDSTFTVITKQSSANEGTYKTLVKDGKYDQMSIFAESAIDNKVDYTITAGGQSVPYAVEYPAVEGDVKFGLIVTDIPETETVTVAVTN